jgi:hypothetical protein
MPHSACRPLFTHMPVGMGWFGQVRRIALADVIYEDQWGQTYRSV